MELLRLNEAFQPVKAFSKYESLIWSERYSTCGDFELKTYNIPETVARFPLESYVAIRESNVPMIVETHSFDKSKGKPASITVRGRTLESVLERRASVIELPSTGVRTPFYITAGANRHSDAAYKLMRMVLGDIARGSLPSVDPFDELDRIPEINLPLPTDFDEAVDTAYEIKSGNLYSVAIEMIQANHHGLRAVRPAPDDNSGQFSIEVYNGRNLTGEGPTGNPLHVVSFDARFNQLEEAKYLLSHQASANVAYVYGPNGASKRLKNAGTEPSGLARRVILVDESSDENLTTPEARDSRGLVELYNNNSVALFEAGVSLQAGRRFNRSLEDGGYALGDVIKLKGEYGLSQNVRVEEFVRVSDLSGRQAYPTFEAVDA